MADYLSINEFPGNGSIMQIEVSFAGNNPDVGSGAVPYFKPADVKAQFFTPATDTTPQIVEVKPLGYVGPNTFITLEPVPTGKILRVYRETEDRYSLVNFVALQNVTERDLDALARQTVFLVEEAKDAAQFAIDTAREAIRYATAATGVAREALALATTADRNASAAVVTANAASNVANQALVNANKAAQDAASAEQHATNVETLAAAAQTKADSAIVTANRADATANRAEGTANAIDGKATAAVATANAATATANRAESTANAIDGKATQAINTANSATTTANQAKATAEGIDAKASQALATANGAAADVAGANTKADQAIQTANQASANVAGKVNRSGDQMTGVLVVEPRVQAIAKADGKAMFEWHVAGQTAGMAWLTSDGILRFGQTGGNGSEVNQAMNIGFSSGNGSVRGEWRAASMVSVDGYHNNVYPQSGGDISLRANVSVFGNMTVTAAVNATTYTATQGSLYLRPAAAVANTHIWFQNQQGGELGLIYTDPWSTMHFRANGGGDTLALYANKTAGFNGNITAPSAAISGRVSAGELLSGGTVWSGNGASWLANDGNVYGGVWGGYLSNWVNSNLVTRAEFGGAVRANVAAFTAGQVGTYAMLQTRGMVNGGPDALVGGDQLGWATCAGDFSEIVGYGTWRVMGRVSTGNKVVSTTIWLRVS
ncbi:putative tail fiber protein [Pseudomonas phage Bf7]|uniref:Putative tail fiber protein n=1 Tax=Pseudomonas phage Bf7 TaxID=1100790 RepID=H2ELX8_9CAUD|nr:tail fiber assembly [Pseudomonas phage Bf7]AEX65880.1 putative tail fiber protein [Pseudomonas phage Bf7]